MAEHTITVEITVPAPTRQDAIQRIAGELQGINLARAWTPWRWSFATHERPDLPATLEAHR